MVKMPFTSQFIDGGGPIIPGPWWPYVFITIACGAISGFHALIGSGTTPKMIEKESQIPMVGYGAMLTEGFVALMALLAAVTLVPNDYFAINTSAAVFAKLNMPVVDLPELSKLVGLDVPIARAAPFPWPSAWPNLCQYRRGAAAHDEVLVPVHHHVRGPLHPHDDRRGDPSGPLHPPGHPGLCLGAPQEDRLDARCHRDQRRSSPSPGATSSTPGIFPRSGPCSA